MSEELFTKLAQTVIDGEPEDAEALAKEALEQGLDPLECINKGLMVGIHKVGELFSCHRPQKVGPDLHLINAQC